MSIGEILIKSGMDTLLGMGTVFSMLMLISFVIYLFKFVTPANRPTAGGDGAGAGGEPAVATGAGADDGELAAVITAAIAAYNRANDGGETIDPDEYIVRSIRRRR